MGGPILPLLVRTRIVLYIDPLLVAKGAALAGGSFSLPYVDVDQDRSMWCWAAVTEGIARSYDNASPWRQCTIAHALLGPLDCCGGPPGDIHPCNVQWELPEPLGKVGHDFGRNAPTFTRVQWEINHQRRVAVRIGFGSGFGHFTAIHGYETSLTDFSVVVADPMYVDGPVPVDVMETNYAQLGGKWDDLYYTAAP